MNPPSVGSYWVEPLGDRDRSSFSCGIPELDVYLRHQARQDAKRKVAAPFVMIDQSGPVCGYYTLSAYTVRLAELPPETARRLPKYPLIPATLLGRLAILKDLRGRNLGRFLLMDALYRSLRNTSEVGSIGVVAEAYDERARAFYLRHEFMTLADHADKLFIAMATVQKAFV